MYTIDDIKDIVSNTNFAEDVAVALIHPRKGDCHAFDAASGIEGAGMNDEFFDLLEAATGKTVWDF